MVRIKSYIDNSDETPVVLTDSVVMVCDTLIIKRNRISSEVVEYVAEGHFRIMKSRGADRKGREEIERHTVNPSMYLPRGVENVQIEGPDGAMIDAPIGGRCVLDMTRPANSELDQYEDWICSLPQYVGSVRIGD